MNYPGNWLAWGRIQVTSCPSPWRGRQGTAVLPSHTRLCSQCPLRHVKPQTQSRGHFSHRLLSFPARFGYKKNPTKQTHIKPNSDLHVKSWCVVKIHRLLKENVYWTNLTSVLENFKSLSCVPERNPNHRKPVSHGLQLLRKLYIRLVPYLLAPYLENCLRMFIRGGKKNRLFSAKQNGLFVFIA